MNGDFLIHDRIFDSEDSLLEASRIIQSLNWNPEIIRGHYFEPKNERLTKQLIGRKNIRGLVPLNWARHSGLIGMGANPLDFYVTHYMKYFPEYYLNQDCLFMPFWALKIALFKNQIFKHLYYSDKLFIKPDNGFKTFTGFSVSKKEWDKEISFLSPANEDCLVLVSSHKEILHEWRFWVFDNEVVTYSSYSWEEQEEKEPEDYIINHAKMIATQVKHLKDFTLDLCLIKGNYYPKVVEINCITTSGTYKCDLSKLIAAIINKN